MRPWFIAGVLFAGVLPVAPAQEGPPPSFDLPALEHGGLPNPAQGLIRLDVDVRDSSQSSVISLERQDFALEDNGQPATIVSMQAMNAVDAATNHSLEVVLVLDEVNMDGLALRAAEQEAAAFLRQHEGKLAEPVVIYRVTKDGPYFSGPSLDGNRLADQVTHRKEANPVWKVPGVVKTPRVDAGSSIVNLQISRSLVALASIAIEERRRPGRKVMFWVGPGWRTAGAVGTGLFDFFTELSTRMREARINLWQVTKWASSAMDGPDPAQPIQNTVYPEYLAGVQPDTKSFDYLGLNVLAAQSGGGVFTTNGSLGPLMNNEVERASRFYVLTFDPPRTDTVDELHHLHVQIDKPGFTASSWTGYFDQPVFYDQPNAGLESVTVAELESRLRAPATVSDEQMAQQLSAIELTERLSSARLAALESGLRGKRARQALIALADESAYLAPPASEVLSTAPPDPASQKQMVARAVAYVNQTLPRLPNFLAERTTTLYHEAEPKPGAPWKTAIGDHSLHKGDSVRASVVFRSGKEVATGGKSARLMTIGTFGPVLGIVMAGATAPKSEVTWARWEKGKNGPQAVFQYHARPEKALYAAGAEYLARDDTPVTFLRSEPFHGEFAMDPESGAILRLSIQADLEPRLPLDESNILVEYGPVLIGGSTYICPLRSISISRQRRFMDIEAWGEDYKVYAPFETLLNEMTFAKYHLFRSSARLLPGFTPASSEE